MPRTDLPTPRRDAASALLRAFLEERARLVDYAARILGERGPAEDVVQDVGLKLCERPAVAVSGPASHYLLRMVRNAAIDRVRQAARERCRLAAADEALEVAAPCTCPLDRLECCEALRAVAAALERLPERTRRVFLAHRIDGVPQKTLASEIGVSPTLVNFMVRDAGALCRAAAA
ncbi:putative ECF RNA polymerase sigma factor SigI [Methylobacterium crusticola]|uniref:ECF RNA polymerase sigma factor SigI n=1 Tax=Methylobacterium crusticola TaxID=1697972 RepID=A0ABQ4R6W2_9HYPH|nr:sigma-70 family RNA polymerase sigma factor [Methylobacterium crusticola]GJD53453.1 putative ECF RNA polymerase sigma factor SigI [Methylobacterium crusticola]